MLKLVHFPHLTSYRRLSEYRSFISHEQNASFANLACLTTRAGAAPQERVLQPQRDRYHLSELEEKVWLLGIEDGDDRHS